MMKREVLAVFAALALAGCASQPRILPPEAAQGMSAVELCRGVATFGPVSAGVAQAEIQRRGVDCAPLMPMISAQDAARNAAALQTLQGQTFQPYQLPAPQQRNPVNCRTVRIGDTWQTDCR